MVTQKKAANKKNKILDLPKKALTAKQAKSVKGGTGTHIKKAELY